MAVLTSFSIVAGFGGKLLRLLALGAGHARLPETPAMLFRS